LGGVEQTDNVAQKKRKGGGPANQGRGGMGFFHHSPVR